MWKCSKCDREFKKPVQHHFCGRIETIDQYISDQPVEVRPALQKIRETIRNAAPDAIEKIAWRMPTFWQGENLIHFAAYKKHIGLYPGDLTSTPFGDRLANYHTTKGTIQFPLGDPIDYCLIAEITRYRVSMIQGNRFKEDPDSFCLREKGVNVP